MDSVSQAVLGACVVTACLHKQAPQRTRLLLLLGSIIGTLPDLDVLVSFGDPVSDFVHHRGATHSLFIQAIATPPIAALTSVILRKWKGLRFTQGSLLLAVYLGLSTHALLDAFTVYGTQLFWPMERHPESWSTLFIIDPLYTLPLLIGTLMAILLSHESKKIRYIWASLALSTLYLGWSMVAKSLVASELERAWERAGIDPIATMSTPSPLNTILWRAVALTQEGYAEMYYSLLASNGALPKIKLYKQDNSLLDEYTHLESVRKLRWFTQDFLKVQKDENGHLIISDLRMGSEPHYVFTFDLGKVGLDSALNPSAPIGPERPHTETQRNTMHPAENPVPTRVRNLPRNLDLGGLLKRIWTH